MRSYAIIALLAPLIVLSHAHAEAIPPFAQTLHYPTGVSSTASLGFNTAPYETSITFQPLAPPDNDYGEAPITTSAEFSGTDLHWGLDLDLDTPLFHLHNYSPTLQCDAVFRLYGLGPADTAIVRVRVVSRVATVRDGNNGLTRGRVAVITNLGSAAHDHSHNMDNAPDADLDTLVVPVRVVGATQLFTFQLSMLNHVEMLDSTSPRVEVTADVSFLDVPPGMTVANAYGYGSVVLEASGDGARANLLRARAGLGGRQVAVWGVAPGAAGAELALYDLAGRRLATGRVEAPASGGVELALPTALTSGVYFVRCADTHGVRTARFGFVR